MINPAKITSLKDSHNTLITKFNLLIEKVKGSEDIEGQGKSPEEEKARILNVFNSHMEKLKTIIPMVESSLNKQDLKNSSPTSIFSKLLELDEISQKFTAELEEIVEDQYECKLELYKQEVLNSLEAVMELFEFITPGIQSERKVLENFYRVKSGDGESVLADLDDLFYSMEENRISMREFIYGYSEGTKQIMGYNELRILNNVFSTFQFYENPPEAYIELNKVLKEICFDIEPLLKEKRNEPEIGVFFSQLVENSNYKISKMEQIFEYNSIFKSLIKKVGKKYSFREEFNKAKALIDQFSSIQKSLIIYNDYEINKILEAIDKRYADQKSKYAPIVKELNALLEEKTISFEIVEMALAKLIKKDFNIVLEEKDVDDITIKITPHLESKFGKDLLERVNIVIQEIDFWYPRETKQILFKDLSATTKKIQADEPVDQKEFLTLMKKYDKEMEQHLRKTYPDKIKLIHLLFDNFQKAFQSRINKDKLEKRLGKKNVWEEINSKLTDVKRNLMVLESGHASLNENVNKFSFIKGASQELCQLFYDLSMQLFILYDGLDSKGIMNMTNILSTYNEFHDVKSLSAAFFHYNQKTSIPNLHVNEKIMIANCHDPRSKAELKKLFPEKEK